MDSRPDNPITASRYRPNNAVAEGINDKFMALNRRPEGYWSVANFTTAI